MALTEHMFIKENEEARDAAARDRTKRNTKKRNGDCQKEGVQSLHLSSFKSIGYS